MARSKLPVRPGLASHAAKGCLLPVAGPSDKTVLAGALPEGKAGSQPHVLLFIK